MNYHIQLVHGDAVEFFLSEWEQGGVEISEAVVGLFGWTERDRDAKNTPERPPKPETDPTFSSPQLASRKVLADPPTHLSDKSLAEGTGDGVDADLSVYGLTAVTFDLKQLIQIGLMSTWTWTGARWWETSPSGSGRGARSDIPTGVREAEQRLRDVLGPGLADDETRQVKMLRLMQAIHRQVGLPLRLEGEVAGLAGHPQPIWVYQSGAIAYNRTPHPLPFLQAVAQLIERRPGSSVSL